MSNQKLITVNPLEVFQQAERFFTTIHQLHRTSDSARIEQIAIPATVLGAFASELYLKALVAEQEKGAIKPIHLLDKLFNELNAGTQKVIERFWNIAVAERKQANRFPKELSGELGKCLVDGADGFRLLRYIYEGGVDFTYNLSDLPIVLRNATVELKPDWFPQPVKLDPHPVLVKRENNTPDLTTAVLRGVINSQASPFQWAVGWGTDRKDGGSDKAPE